MIDARTTRSPGASAEPDGAALAALIAGSDILMPMLTGLRGSLGRHNRPTSVPVSRPTLAPNWGPTGYEQVDRQVLDWIASHRTSPSARTLA